MDSKIRDELVKLSQELQSAQKEYLEVIEAHRSYMAQQKENEMVKGELDILENDAVIYKIMGPVLVKQELNEAKQTVDQRLQFIGKEVKSFKDKATDLEKKQNALRERLMELQQKNVPPEIQQKA